MSQTNTKAWLAMLTASVSTLALATGAAAQTEAGAEDANQLTEIVVTAQRRAESLQDVPASIDVATGEQIQRLNILDVKDVQQLSPGLELTNKDGRSNTATLRGISFNPDQGTSPAVDLYFNEVPVDAQTAFTAMYDIQQIEVLRGPQGALRGRTAPAGAITIRTRRPDLNDVTGYAQGSYSDRAAYNVQGGVSIPIVPGKLAVRVSGLTDANRLNHVYNVNRDERSRSRTESGRLSILFEPDDNLTVNLSYQYLNAKNRQFLQAFGPGNAPFFGDPTRNGPPLAISDRASVTEGPYQFDNKTELLTASVDWNLGWGVLSFVGGHQDSELTQTRDQDPYNAIPGYQTSLPGRLPYNVDTAELRLSSANEGFWNWSVGAFYVKQTGAVRIQQSSDLFFFPGRPTPFVTYLPINAQIDIPVDARSMSLAASSRFQFTDKLRLEVAARLNKIESEQTATLTVSSPAFPTSVVEGIPARLAKTDETPVTGGATLTYEADPDTTVYAAYGRSFRSGTAGVAAPTNISDSLVRTDSETSDAIELGLKKNFLERRLSLNVAAFYQKFDGYISRVSGVTYDNGVTPQATGVPEGAPDGIVDGSFDFNWNGDATVKGVEVTFAGRPIDNWDFSVSAAYVKARYDNALSPCNDYNGDGQPDSIGTPVITGGGNVSYCARNDSISDSPNFSLTANSELRFPVGELEPFVRALFTYRPDYNSRQQNFDFKSRELLNLYAGVRGPDGKWEIYAFAKNVLDQTRITAIGQDQARTTTLTPGADFLSGYTGVSLTPPREFGIAATFNF